MDTNNTSVEFCFVTRKKRLEVGIVKISRALGLGQSQEEEEEGLQFPIERQPADQPFGHGFNGHEGSDDCPVDGPFVEIGGGERTV